MQLLSAENLAAHKRKESPEDGMHAGTALRKGEHAKLADTLGTYRKLG